MNQVVVSSLIALGLALVDVLADTLIKKAGAIPGQTNLRLFIPGLLAYGLTAVGWLYVFRSLKLSTVGVFYGVSSVLLLVVAGVVFFGERLNVPECVGIVLAITSIILLARFA